MASTYTIQRRGDRKIACKVCGQKDLEWVKTALGWRYVPYGTNDFSETVHALTPGGCKKSGVPAPVAAAAGPPVDLGPIEEQLAALRLSDRALAAQLAVNSAEIGKVATRAVDFRPIEAEIATLRKLVESVKAAKPIAIQLASGQTVDVGRQHDQFLNLAAMTAAVKDTGVVFLVGEPGSFKTSAVKPLAQALGVTYEVQPVGMQTTKSDLLGFVNGHGDYVESPAHRVYRNGGLLLWDEIDAANAATLTIINGLTANHSAGFPGGMVDRHPDCYFVVAGNTFGRGADAQFIGRSQLDAATLNRFCYLPWNTDWTLVGEIMGLTIQGDQPDYPTPGRPRDLAEFADWGEYCKRIHNIVTACNIRAVVSSRSVLNGAKMLAAGIDRGLVEYSTIWAHMSAQDAATVKANLV